MFTVLAEAFFRQKWPFQYRKRVFWVNNVNFLKYNWGNYRGKSGRALMVTSGGGGESLLSPPPRTHFPHLPLHLPSSPNSVGFKAYVPLSPSTISALWLTVPTAPNRTLLFKNYPYRDSCMESQVWSCVGLKKDFDAIVGKNRLKKGYRC